MAYEKDQELKRAIQTGQVESLGRLHGIPVSVKDQVINKGMIIRVIDMREGPSCVCGLHASA